MPTPIGTLGFNPISSATSRMPIIVSLIKSGSSIPSMFAPFSMIERSTPAAKRLSFHFFLTDLVLTSSTLLDGRTRTVVTTRPVSSSMVYRTFSISDYGLTSVQIPQPWLTTARMYSSGQSFSRKISSVL